MLELQSNMARNKKAFIIKSFSLPDNEESTRLLEKIEDIRRVDGYTFSHLNAEALKEYAARHWPGNPQMQLTRFGSELSLICFRCHKTFQTLRRVEYISGFIGHTCTECLKQDKQKQLVKKELGNI